MSQLPSLSQLHTLLPKCLKIKWSYRIFEVWSQENDSTNDSSSGPDDCSSSCGFCQGRKSRYLYSFSVVVSCSIRKLKFVKKFVKVYKKFKNSNLCKSRETWFTYKLQMTEQLSIWRFYFSLFANCLSNSKMGIFGFINTESSFEFTLIILKWVLE